MESKRLQKLLLTLVKTSMCASSMGGMRMPTLGSNFGGLRRISSWEVRKV